MARYNYFMPKFFGGIDRRKSADPFSSASVCENFRFSDRMSLRSRCGFYPLASLKNNVRGLTSVTLGGRQWLIVAAGNTLYSVSDGATELGRLSRSEGDVIFFVYDDSLMIFDGDAGFTFDSVSLKPLSPYIPMVARCGSDEDSYQLVEPINLMTDRIRIRFDGIRGSREHYLVPGMYEIIDVTALDGTPLDYWELEDDKIVFPDGMPTGGYYEVLCRTDESIAKYSERNKIFSAKFGEVFGRVTQPRLYLFSSTERGRVYYSRKPDSNYYSGEGFPFYFCDENSFTVGQGEVEICGACRFLDRMFIFTEEDAWFLTASTPDEASPFHSNVGCAILGGAIPLDNNPVTIGRDGIYLWENVSGYTECSANFMSPEIAAELTEEVIYSLRAVGVCAARNELWLCPDSSHGGGAVIWDYRRRIFYRFSGFQVGFMAEYASDVVFSDGKNVYGFSETADSDDGAEIVAVWENSFCVFSDYPSRMRLHRAAFTAYPDGGEVSLAAITDKGRTVCVSDGGVIAGANDASVPLTFEKRAKSGDFHRAKLRVTSRGGRSEIVSAALGIEVLRDI